MAVESAGASRFVVGRAGRAGLSQFQRSASLDEGYYVHVTESGYRVPTTRESCSFEGIRSVSAKVRTMLSRSLDLSGYQSIGRRGSAP